MPCAKHLVEVRNRWSEFERRDARALAISFSSPAEAGLHAGRLKLPFELAVDPARTTYVGYGVARGTPWQAWHPKAQWKYFCAWLRGEEIAPSRRGDDLLQLGADFVIGPNRTVRLAYYSRRSDDRPAVDLLLAALDGRR